MANSGTAAGQHDTPQRTGTYERPFTREDNYLVPFALQAISTTTFSRQL